MGGNIVADACVTISMLWESVSVAWDKISKGSLEDKDLSAVSPLTVVGKNNPDKQCEMT